NPPPDTRPDFSATAKIITDTRKNVLSIPIIALTVRQHQDTTLGDTAQLAMGGRQPAKQVGQQDVEGVFVIGKDNIVVCSYQAIRDLKEGMQVKETKTDPTKAKKESGA